MASNLKHLMQTYSKGFAVGLTPTELEKGCGVSAKTIRRMMDPYSDHTPTLDNIDRIAEFFGIATWEILRPRPALVAAGQVEVSGPHLPPRTKR